MPSKARPVIEQKPLNVKCCGITDDGDVELSIPSLGKPCMTYIKVHTQYIHSLISFSIIKDQTDAERAALPKCENASYLQLYHELSLLRLPLQFDILIGTNLQYENSKDKSKVQLVRSNNSTKSAISSYVMRSGVHYVEFPNLGGFMQSTTGCWDHATC